MRERKKASLIREAKKGDEQQLQGYVTGLSSPDKEVRHTSEQALVHAGTAAVDPLIRFIREEREPDFRWYAARALARIGQPAVHSLIEALKAEQREDVRKYFAAAIAEMREPPVYNVIELFREKDPALRGYGTLILCRIGEAAIGPLKESLGKDNTMLKKCAEYTLLRIGADSYARDASERIE